MSLVLDGSAALAWLYPEETTDPISAVFERIVHSGAIVPTLWRIEIANSLTVAVRRGRMTARERRESLSDLDQLLIVTDAETEAHVWGDALRLADKHRLTVYDATYLELALRGALPLATLDQDLRAAARKERVALLGI